MNLVQKIFGTHSERELKRIEGTVQAIEKAGHNYVRLQDLRDSRIEIGYDSKAGVPVVTVK